MASILLAALFGFAALAAIGGMLATWRQYGRAALALHGQLANCPASREFRVRTVSLKVTPASAKILRPRFNASAARPTSALPAAA